MSWIMVLQVTKGADYRLDLARERSNCSWRFELGGMSPFRDII